jgi:hypothetical protein
MDRNKDITLNASSVEHYLQMLEKLPLNQRLREETIRRARKYAYHFFFRRMILEGYFFREFARLGSLHY